MYGIICKKDGNPRTSFPIIDEHRECMATWKSLKKAKEFAEEHILCMVSEVLFIDLENNMIVY